MSLILDALNRAENERKNQNTVPDLNTSHRPLAVNAAPGLRPTMKWMIGIVLILIAIIVALVWVLRREPVSAINNMPVQPSSVAPANNPIAVEPSSTVVTAATPATVPVVEVTPKASAPDADINKLYSAEDTAPAAAVDSGVSELYAAEAATAAASETIVDPFTSGNAGVPLQEQAPARTFDSIKNIPDFNALPWNMRQKIPTISYARHNFLVGGVSTVVINNQTSGVGNIIGVGQFVVQEIFVDGVVLKHGNAVFKLRALNGWINM
ncbi:hypothetical protein [Cellvibrio sp. OA-2007]|uniref:hypothetical protein n=1 Tax=Cellvibrio sp. OA-2007 TaxID=529823 RepID=UPI0007802A88|nr:hypothetical protein [Cellvibrio sp. OA-2007]